MGNELREVQAGAMAGCGPVWYVYKGAILIKSSRMDLCYVLSDSSSCSVENIADN